jgi:hypothetical protein
MNCPFSPCNFFPGSFSSGNNHRAFPETGPNWAACPVASRYAATPYSPLSSFPCPARLSSLPHDITESLKPPSSPDPRSTSSFLSHGSTIYPPNSLLGPRNLAFQLGSELVRYGEPRLTKCFFFPCSSEVQIFSFRGGCFRCACDYLVGKAWLYVL